MSESTERPLGARDLLVAFLELQRMSPTYDDWTEARLADNPPRLARLRRLRALFKAFDVAWDPTGFGNGAFIRPADARYDAVAAKLSAELARRGWPAALGPSRYQLPKYFGILFDYRRRADELLAYSSGVLEASGLYLLAHTDAGEASARLAADLAPVEATLAAFVSPTGATFTVEQLTRDFGYPDVDLFDVDCDWL